LLKSPTTDTRRAFGAHTPKHTPSMPSTGRLGAEAPGQVAVVAFGEQVKVHVAQRAKAVGVFGHLLAAGPADLQQVGCASSRCA
jgi:hypothetical protein